LTVNAHEKEIIKSEGPFCYRCGMDFSRFVSAMESKALSQPPMDDIAIKASRIDALLLFKESGRKYENMELSFSDFVHYCYLSFYHRQE